MAKPRVLVLRSPGTNCDEETAEAFRLAGGDAQRIHVARVLEAPSLLDDFQVLCIPGGFSYGDDVSAGRVLGNQVRLHLADACRRFRDAGKLVLGVCNGFQVLIKTGLLDVEDERGPLATLTWNENGHYEARWVTLQADPGACVFLRGIERLELPVAHAEGQLAVRDDAALARLHSAGQIVLRYAAPGAAASDEPLAFPHNPNGAVANAAGLCDSTGRVLGLMPHPERFIDATQHPAWTRRRWSSGGGASLLEAPGAGLALFRNAIDYFG
ncbi:MAG: phosphoribosylformylglycinamidine synthase subunit PurQ [Lacipirellulaceae bacterium]